MFICKALYAPLIFSKGKFGANRPKYRMKQKTEKRDFKKLNKKKDIQKAAFISIEPLFY